ncbi:hypothetical protein [Beijerinckia sp. L45]|uniref:hypothetical protein n=1 Tax=Beijerinckia sp. L45 TaxID=1641855 RepID=UPI00131DC782|nr:hypothetical protein [Beijerinckia sp. L45]
MAETLKSYLIDIGFKVDQIAQRQAEDVVKRNEERTSDAAEKAGDQRAKREAKEASDREKGQALAAKKEQERLAGSLNSFRSFSTKFLGIQAVLGAVTGLTAAGIVKAVDNAAKSYERLQYLGQRNGTTAGKASGFGYASSQLGSSADEANASLEAFGKNLRVNGAGYAQSLDQVLRRVGKSSRDAKGQLRDSADLATDLGDALRDINGKEGYGVALAWGKSFGFEEQQARAMMDPNFRAREGQFQADHKTVGADPNAAAATGIQFEQSMRHLQEVLDAIGTRISTTLFQKLRPLLDDLSQWFLAHGKEVGALVQRVADDLIKLASAIADELAGADWNKILGFMERLAGGFGLLLEKLGGNSGLVALLAGLVGSLRILRVLAIPPWLAAALGVGVAGAIGAVNTAAAIQHADPAKNDVYVDPETGMAYPTGPGGGNQIKGQPEGQGLLDRAKRWFKRGSGKNQGGWWTPERQKHAYEYLTSRGFTDAGARAAVSRMAYVESTKDGPDASNASGHSGIFQASRDRAAKYGNSRDFDDQLKAYADQAYGPDGMGAGKILSTAKDDAEAARGAAVMERAEGWNGQTDSWAWKTRENMDNVRRNVRPAPPMPSASPKTDDTIKPVSLGPSPVQSIVISNAARGRLNVAHNPTFEIEGGDSASTTQEARLMPDRGPPDWLRNLQGAEA